MKKIVKNTAKAMFIATLGLLLIIGCKKKEKEEDKEETQPVASFTTDKAEYDGGETIILTSTSQNAGSVKWILPNGTTSNDKVVSFVTSTTVIDMELPVTLHATSPKGTKTDYVIKNIKVKAEPEEEQPVASFTTDKAEYKGGETIILTSTSTGTGTVTWTLPDNSTSTEKVLSYVTATTSAEQNLSFKLEATSPKGTKTHNVTKSIKVTPTEGTVAMYKKHIDNSGTVTGTLTIGSTVYGEITIPKIDDEVTSVDCSHQGLFKLSLPAGQYSFSLVIPGIPTPITGYANVYTNFCSLVQF